MVTRLILVRHGETKWNKENVFRGQSDIPLSEKGRRQANLTGKALSSLPFTVIFTSPLRRAYQTAASIAEWQQSCKEVIAVKGLIDINFGSWQGLKVEEVLRRYPHEYDLWVNKPQSVMFPEGESLEAARLRAWGFVQNVLQDYRNKNICLVSHRVVVRLILLTALGLDSSLFWHIEQGTCALNMITYNEKRGFVIHFINERCHLQPWLEAVPFAPPPD